MESLTFCAVIQIKKLLRLTKIKFGEKSSAVLVSKIQTILPPDIKNAENLFAFKPLIKIWDSVNHGALYKCNLCRKLKIDVNHVDFQCIFYSWM